MKRYVNVEEYLASLGRGKEYWINLVVEDEDGSYIAAGIKHEFAGHRNDGLFLVHFLEDVKDIHFSIHSDGTRHQKINWEENGQVKSMEFPLSRLPALSTLTAPVQAYSVGLNIRRVKSRYRAMAKDERIKRFGTHPDQIITLNRKYAEYDQLSFSVWILPSGTPFPTECMRHLLNPRLYLFNLLQPEIAVVVQSQALPQVPSQSQLVYSTFAYEYQTSLDPASLWVEFEPSLVSGTEMQIPEWTFRHKGREYPISATRIELREGAKLYLGQFNGRDHYHYDLIGARIPPFDREGPTCPVIVWVQGGVVRVLRHRIEKAQ